MAAVWLLGVTLGSLPTFGWNGSQKPKKPGESECNYFRIMDEDFVMYKNLKNDEKWERKTYLVLQPKQDKFFSHFTSFLTI